MPNSTTPIIDRINMDHAANQLAAQRITPGPWEADGDILNISSEQQDEAAGFAVEYAVVYGPNRAANTRAMSALPDLIAALHRLSAAALSRDVTMGDPISLINAKAELAAANKQAIAALHKTIGA